MVKKGPKPPTEPSDRVVSKTIRIRRSQVERIEKLIKYLRDTQPDGDLSDNQALVRSLLFVMAGVELEAFSAEDVARVKPK